MRQTRKHFLYSLLALFVLSLAVAAQGMAPEAQKADEVVNSYAKEGRFSGAVLVAKGGKVILSQGYGMANYEFDVPNTPRTKFRLGSITKQFTALGIAQLEERGLLNVNDPITKYLPTYTKEVGDKVTIYHLLTHTSGIPSFTNFPEYATTIKFEKFNGERLLAWLKDKPLEFVPGEKFKYNNSGYYLLGYIIEKISGKSYEQYVKENIFEPLGMADTGYDSNSLIIKNRAAGYIMRNARLENADYINMTVPGGAGALYSTVEDLYKYDRSLYTEKLVKKATFEKIYTPFKSNYAWGWVVEQFGGRKRIAHSGGIEGFNTILWRFVNDDTCVITLSNRNTNVLDAMAQRLAAVMFGEKYELPQAPVPTGGKKEIKVDAKLFDAYAGDYEVDNIGILHITKENDRLYGQPEGESKQELIPESETKFKVTNVNATIIFVKDANGKVTGIEIELNGQPLKAKKIK